MTQRGHDRAAEELEMFSVCVESGGVVVSKNESSHLLNLYFIYYM